MNPFKDDVLKKVTITKGKFEKKRQELLNKRSKLIEDKDFLRSELENDFQRQIMEGTKPDKKLQLDYEKVANELEQVNILLKSLDGLLEKELSKFVDEVKKERQRVIDDIKAKNEQFEKELAKLKYQFLDKLASHVELRNKHNNELRKFREVEELLTFVYGKLKM